MGVKGLSKYMNEHFSRWGSVNLNDLKRLVIDGDSICTQLYAQIHAEWLLGGEYCKFHTASSEFFSEILFSGVKPLVILSGIKEEGKYRESAQVRGAKFNDTVRRAQGRMGHARVHEVWTTPLMATKVFTDVLRSLNIELRVADGEARREAAAFANHHKCPLLGANSDFFLFDLEGGYIPLEKLSTVIANGLVYHRSELQTQFGFKDPQLPLMLPALHGNDYIDRTTEEPCDFGSTLQELSTCKNCQEYLATREPGEDLRRNFESATSYYCNLQLPPDDDCPGGLEIFIGVPEWVVSKFRLACFEPQLLNVSLNGRYVLLPMVEDIKRDSTWLASRGIRQFLYGFIGISPHGGKVTETIRAKSSPEVIDAVVSPRNFEPLVDFRNFEKMDRESLASVVLDVLICHRLSQDDMQREFNTLEDKWKLPVAAACYWYQTCGSPSVQRHLVKALVMSFITCSREESPANEVPCLETVTVNTKPDVLMAVHAFAQWQCVYHDAMALNYVAREPFPTTSPASLYSGGVAMHYASFARRNLSVDGAIAAEGKKDEGKLYRKLLYLVTGCDGGGKVGGHARHQPRPKAPLPTAAMGPPALAETNRYALLPDYT